MYIPWSTLICLKSLSINVQLALFAAGNIASNDGGSRHLLGGASRLPALTDLSIQYTFTNRFESITNVADALFHTCEQTIDSHFSNSMNFESLKVFKLGARMTLGQDVVIGSEGRFEEMVKDFFPSLYRADGRVENGLSAIIYPSLQ